MNFLFKSSEQRNMLDDEKHDERRGRTNISRSLVGAPKVRTNLRYGFDQGVASATAFAHDFFFVANDAFNNESLATARQPLGFDEYATFYRRYRVHRVKLDLTVTAMYPPAATTSNWATYHVVVFPSPSRDTAATPMSIQSALERPMARYMTVNTSLSGGASKRMDCRFKSTWAVTGAQADDEDYTAFTQAALGATRPAKLWFWHVLVYLQDNPVTATADYFNARLTGLLHFDVEFYDRQVLAPF